MTQQFLRKEDLIWDLSNPGQDQRMTLTCDIHVASFTDLFECLYQLWDHMLQQFLKNK